MDPDHAGEGREDVEHGDVTSLLAFEVFLEVHGRDDGKADDGAVGDLEEGGGELGVPEALDYEGAEVAHGPVDDLCGEAEEEEEPRLGVGEGLDDLVAFEVGILDARVVVSESFDRKLLL